MERSQFLTIGREFSIRGEFVSAVRLLNGHINETYVATYRAEDGESRFVHQKINDRIFTNVPALMENIGRVTSHIRDKLARRGANDVSRRVLTLVPAVLGGNSGPDVVRAADGSWWRTYRFIENARTHDVVDSPHRARSAARAFGRFISDLADMDGPRLHETIPNFHATRTRFVQFREAVDADSLDRARDATEEIKFCLENEALADRLEALRDSGIARECVTHNDAKLNNIMVDDATGEAICVIDLDTVMPGLALHDFGDMVRTAAMPAAEDETDLSLVEVDVAMFEALVQGFTQGAGGLLSREEPEHFVSAGQVMTFECGLRFLADYLQGDAYFRTSRPKQNLDRARTQFALVRSLEQNRSRLEARVAPSLKR